MEENTGFMDQLAEDVAAFDVVKFLPKLDNVLGWVDLLVRLAVLAGPVLILVLGLMYYISPPKEANHQVGYRFYWGMGSVQAWRFTQRIAGTVWIVLGGVLTVIMLLMTFFFGTMDALEMANAAMICVLWQLVLIGLSCVFINVVVAKRYDRKGEVRPDTRIPEDFLKLPLKKKK